MNANNSEILALRIKDSPIFLRLRYLHFPSSFCAKKFLFQEFAKHPRVILVYTALCYFNCDKNKSQEFRLVSIITVLLLLRFYTK